MAGKTRDEFVEIMNNINLPKPKLTDIAIPANHMCDLTEENVPEPEIVQG